MAILSTLEMGRYYPKKWVEAGFLISLVVSLALRSMPITLGHNLVWLYFLPFWLCVEVLLIWLFAVYGWLGVSLSIAADAFLRPNLLVWPSLLWFSDLTLLTLVILWLTKAYKYKDGRTDSNIEQQEWLVWHPLILLIIYGVIMFVVVRAFSVSMSDSAWIQLFTALPCTFLITYFGGSVFTSFFLDHWRHLITPLSLTPTAQQTLVGIQAQQKVPKPTTPSTQKYAAGQFAASSGSAYSSQISQSGQQTSSGARAKSRTPSPSAVPSRPVAKGPSRSTGKTVLAKPSSSSAQMIGVNKTPSVGDMVQSTVYGRIALTREITSGGEGTIFETDKGLVCKVYKKEKLTTTKRDKLEIMLKKQVNIQGVCWPKDIVTYNREFVGFLMDKAEGKPMQTSVFMKQLLFKNFPHWRRIHLVELAITILNKVVELHRQAILIGDINPLNILIKDEKNVHFVDTDSYQIDQIPCPVGTVNFTAPEIQGQDFKSFLRTPEHEYFAVATLMFMILLPGKPPYSQQGGGNPSENIRNADFSYPLGDQTNRRAPPGPWKYIWSHLPRYVKTAFYEVFKEGKRISSEQWLGVMTRYHNDFQKGWISSDEIYPTGFKQVELVVVQCSACGRVDKTAKSYLESLERRGKLYKCPECQRNKTP